MVKIIFEKSDNEKNSTNNQEVSSVSNEVPLKEGLFLPPIFQSLSQNFNISNSFELIINKSTLEKVSGTNNLMNIAWLSRGLELTKIVARIITTQGIGTGFLISTDLILTNNHVLPEAELAAKSTVEFNYQKDWSGKPEAVQSYTIDSTRFKTNKSLDYTIIRVNGNPGKQFGYIDLNTYSKDPSVNDYTCIIQHPAGGYKQIALTDNKVASVFDNVVQYITDTEPGSSGSPVFDQNWNIVALHHAGGMLPGPDGKRLFCNEGIRIKSILKDARGFLGLPDPLNEINFGKLALGIITVASTLTENNQAFQGVDFNRIISGNSNPIDELFQGINSNREINLSKIISGLIAITNGTIETIQPMATALLLSDPDFKSAFYDYIKFNRNNELLPLLVTAAGVAVGAGIRHWSNSQEMINQEFINKTKKCITLSNQLTDFLRQHQKNEKIPSQIYNDIYIDLRGNLTLMEPIINKLGIKFETKTFEDKTNELLPIFASAFIAGVGTGAASTCNE